MTTFRTRSAGATRAGPAVLLALALAAAGCEGEMGPPGPAGTTAALGEGLHMTITSASIGGDGRPVVSFTLEDDDGNPVDLSDLDRHPSFLLAWIDVDPDTGLSRYQSYVTRTVTGSDYTLDGVVTPPALASAEQPTTDSGGTMQTVGEGSFRYTFATALPPDYDRNATHTLGAYVHREDRAYVDNPIYDFVPSGGPITLLRETVATDACNDCHDPLEAHGGVRRETVLCQLCHTDQGTDPETGHTIEFKAMVHKIHRGKDLTLQPYYIVGYRQSVHDYSEVGFPQDIRNCTKCHRDAGDADNWKTKPSRTACGSCHDDVNFVTGENHSDFLSQDSDIACTICHRADTGIEFDRSIAGAHVVPAKSSVNPNLTLAITDVQNMLPGVQPSVRFTITDDSGPVDIATVDRVAILFGGPTADYTQLISLDHRFTIQGGGSTPTLTVNAVGDYTYAPDLYAIPASATGTWSVGMEARTASIAAGSENVRFGANNPVVYVDLDGDGTLGGGSPVARRQVVDEALCNQCHDDLVMHGNLRTDIEYCVMCHNPWATDEARRPGLDAGTNPPESVDMKLMVHRIHRGHDLENGYTVYGYGGSEHDFTEVHYPGDLRNCATCHPAGTTFLPSPPGASANVINIGGVTTPQYDAICPPSMTACTGCHDSTSTWTHAWLNAIVNSETDWMEACATCHEEGSEFGIDEEHARS